MMREGSGLDIPACARIITDSPLWRKFGRTIADAERIVSGTFMPGQRMWVHEGEEGIDGFVITLDRGMMGEFGYIRLIGVEAARRGSGIGTALLILAEDHLFSIGSFVFLTVTDFNRDARRLYERLGYSEVGVIPDYRTPGIAEAILLKRKA